jgi:sugar (pentulose or hexulose) kinase
MHRLVALDGEGHPLCPAILWNDGRGVTEARRLSHCTSFVAVVIVKCASGFQILDLPRERWLGQMQAFGRFGEA